MTFELEVDTAYGHSFYEIGAQNVSWTCLHPWRITEVMLIPAGHHPRHLRCALVVQVAGHHRQLISADRQEWKAKVRVPMLSPLAEG